MTMADKFLNIPNYDILYYPFCMSHIVFETFGHLINQPIKKKFKTSTKLLSNQISKRYYETLKNIVLNSPLSPSSLTQLSLFRLRAAGGLDTGDQENRDSNLQEHSSYTSQESRYKEYSSSTGIQAYR